MSFFVISKKIVSLQIEMIDEELTYYPKESDFSKVTFWEPILQTSTGEDIQTSS